MYYDGVVEGAVLRLREKLPRISVETASGPLKLSSYEQRKNLLIMLLDPYEEAGAQYLRDLAAQADELRELSTAVLVVSPGDQPGDVPSGFVSGADASGSLRKRFLPADAAPNTVGLWLSDRFGELYHQSIAGSAEGLTPAAELLQWVQLVEAQCP